MDGWALTMLSKENVGLASICNSIGQALGVFLANQGCITLTDPVWCHKTLGTLEGKAIFSLADFFLFWGWVFIVITILITLFKVEKSMDAGDEPDGFMDTLFQVVAVFKIKSVQSICLLLLTCRIAFASSDSLFTFQLQEFGVNKGDIAALSSFLFLLGFFLPALLGRLAAQR